MTLPPAPSTGGGPVTRVWKAAHRLRANWYAKRGTKLPRPTVSLGNLHWGGTGKTPLVAAVARRFQTRGRQVAVLSRGYGRSTRGPVVVSRGEGPEVDVARAGDEPFLLADAMHSVHVVVAEDRIEAGRAALELAPTPDLFVLDDGFSHLSLTRDLDLLAIPVDDPWGGGRLPPRGRLREPLESSRRAHALLVTGGDVAPDTVETIRAVFGERGFAGRAFAAPTRIGAPRDVASGERLTGGEVVLVTGIARPERVTAAAAERGILVRDHVAFPDHHDYPPRSLDRIRRRVEATGAGWVLTTTKDLVKLRGRLEARLAVLPVEAEPEEGFWPWIDELLARAERPT